MKLDRGMGTLMTAFSGIAALMCLLVGLQLLSLETRIRREADQSGSHPVNHLRQWENEVHTGAVMSFGAGLLILLFGVRHQATRRRERTSLSGGRARNDDPEAPDSWSVRIFEVEDDAAPVEITDGGDEIGEPSPAPEPAVWAPLAEDDLDPGLENHTNPAESILDSIHEATGTGPDRPSARPRKSFWNRIFRR
jgi:hypothetical protein